MISAFCLLLALLCALTLSVSLLAEGLAQVIFAWQDYKEDRDAEFCRARHRAPRASGFSSTCLKGHDASGGSIRPASTTSLDKDGNVWFGCAGYYTPYFGPASDFPDARPFVAPALVVGALPTVEMPIDDTEPYVVAEPFSSLVWTGPRVAAAAASSGLCAHPLTCDHWLCLTEIFGGTRSP